MPAKVSHWTALSRPDDLGLTELTAPAEMTNWSVNRNAQPDDYVHFYVTKPKSAFVATAIIRTVPKPRPDSAWWDSDMDGITPIRPPYHISDARHDLLPHWKWLKSPIASVRIPDNVVPLFVKRIGRLPRRSAVGTAVPDDDRDPPPRIKIVTTRVVRDTAKGYALKRLYGFACQVCGSRVCVPGMGEGYAEVHHLRPLGGPHQGKDNWDNMVVLCPNCHVAFDLLALAIEPGTGKVHSFDPDRTFGTIRFRSRHQLASENIKYQWRRYRKSAEA